MIFDLWTSFVFLNLESADYRYQRQTDENERRVCLDKISLYINLTIKSSCKSPIGATEKKNLGSKKKKKV